MAMLDGWSLVPLAAALVATVLVVVRARSVMFRAALDGRAFARDLAVRLSQEPGHSGGENAARALARQLRPAWAAEAATRALDAAVDERGFVLEEARAEFALAAQRGLLAIRTLGRLSLPLALAIAIVEIARGFDPTPELALDRSLAAGRAIARGVFAVSTGMAASIGCQVSYGVLVRAARERLREVQLASEVFSSRG